MNKFEKLIEATKNNWNIEKNCADGLSWEAFCWATYDWAITAKFTQKQITEALKEARK